jgi:hypothetical protein
MAPAFSSPLVPFSNLRRLGIMVRFQPRTFMQNEIRGRWQRLCRLAETVVPGNLLPVVKQTEKLRFEKEERLSRARIPLVCSICYQAILLAVDKDRDDRGNPVHTICRIK